MTASERQCRNNFPNSWSEKKRVSILALKLTANDCYKLSNAQDETLSQMAVQGENGCATPPFNAFVHGLGSSNHCLGGTTWTHNDGCLEETCHSVIAIQITESMQVVCISSVPEK